MEVVPSGAGPRGIVDYAHSPDAIARVLGALRADSDGRLIVVLGAGGDRDRSKREAMGAAAASLADVVVVTDDNPRSEDPAAIRGQVRAGAATGRALVHEEGDRRAAIARAVALGGAGDTVVVLGKGHEQGQEVAGTMTPFDDASVLREALAAGDPG
jgi:UDP-N-acetylmuramoyl-L-alanyl-D-glutamate--2,6-diaminopimelate ligase